MGAYCMYTGSYYDQAPWTEQHCPVDAAVPEGCPIHLVSGAPFDPQHVTVERVAGNGTGTQTASTTTIIGSDDRSFSLPDEFSCDCALTGVHISFQHVEVAVPAAVAGESVRIWGTVFQGGPYEVQITAPGPCATPDWPESYDVALACDRCPVDPDMDSDGDGIPDDVDTHDDSGGCAAGGDPSVIFVGLALLPFLRRRRAKILSSE